MGDSWVILSGIISVMDGRLFRSVEFIIRVIANANKTHVRGDWGPLQWLEDIDSIDIHISTGRTAGHGRCSAVAIESVVGC